MATELITCPACNGDQGEYIAADEMIPCSECNGTGEMEVEIEVEMNMTNEEAIAQIREWAEFYQYQRCVGRECREKVDAQLAAIIALLTVEEKTDRE